MEVLLLFQKNPEEEVHSWLKVLIKLSASDKLFFLILYQGTSKMLKHLSNWLDNIRVFAALHGEKVAFLTFIILAFYFTHGKYINCWHEGKKTCSWILGMLQPYNLIFCC